MEETKVTEPKVGGKRAGAGRPKSKTVVDEESSNKAQAGMMKLYKLALGNLKKDMTSSDEKIRQNASLYVSRTVIPDKIEAKDPSEGLSVSEIASRVFALFTAKLNEYRNNGSVKPNVERRIETDVPRPSDVGGLQDNKEDRLLCPAPEAVAVPQEPKA